MVFPELWLFGMLFPFGEREIARQSFALFSIDFFSLLFVDRGSAGGIFEEFCMGAAIALSDRTVSDKGRYAPLPLFGTPRNPACSVATLMGLSGALAAAATFVALWSVLACRTGLSFGYASLAIGGLVGFAARKCSGRPSLFLCFGAAIVAMLGCLASVVGPIALLFAERNGFNPLASLSAFMWPDVSFSVLRENMQPLDGLFLAVAALAAVRTCQQPAPGQ